VPIIRCSIAYIKDIAANEQTNVQRAKGKMYSQLDSRNTTYEVKRLENELKV
jgi:hypothetical protein